MKKSDYGPLSFDDVLTFRVGDALEDCERQEFRARQESWRARKGGMARRRTRRASAPAATSPIFVERPVLREGLL